MKFKNIFFDSEGKTEVKIDSSRGAGKFVLLKLEGANDPESAARYKGKNIYVKRSQLNIPEGKILMADLYGLPVADADSGKIYGEITDIIFNPANYIYVIKTPDGERMIPAVPEFIAKTDVYDAVYIRPIKGMFDDAD